MGKIIRLPLFLVLSVLIILSNFDRSYSGQPPKSNQQGIQPGQDTGMDTYISKGLGEEHRNFGKSEDMYVGDSDKKRVLLRFDLASIPPGASITSAELKVCLAEEYYCDQKKAIYVHRITSFWKDTEATWNENRNKHNWKSPGGDLDLAIESAASLIGRSSGWVSWDVTRAVKDWFEGRHINFGFLLRQDINDSNEICFLSSDLKWEAYRPRLVISYELGELSPEPVSPSIKVYPNPFKPSAGHTEVTFVNLPSGASVKIFHIEGSIITTLKENGGEAKWDVRDNEGREVSSGFYLYRIESEKEHQTGKIVIIR